MLHKTKTFNHSSDINRESGTLPKTKMFIMVTLTEPAESYVKQRC